MSSEDGRSDPTVEFNVLVRLGCWQRNIPLLILLMRDKRVDISKVLSHAMIYTDTDFVNKLRNEWEKERSKDS